MAAGSPEVVVRLPMTRATWLVAALGVAVVALPVTAGAVAATMVALAGAIVLSAAAALRPAALPASALVPLGAVAVLALWLSLTAALSVEPRVSFFGLVGQHDGALLWVICAVLAWSAAVTAGPRALRLLVSSISTLGGVFGVGAILDAAGILDRIGRFSLEASGFMENSLSLGQVLLLSLGCSVAWAITAPRPSARLTAGAFGAIALIGLVLAQSRAAWLALIAAAAVAALLHGTGPRWRRAAVIALVALTLGTVALMPAALDGRLGEGVVRSVRAVIIDRADIWSSAFAVAGQDPVLGRGPDQFSCWAIWNTPTADGIESTGAYDPHDVLLYLLVSAGVPGLLLGCVAFALFGDALLRASARRGGVAVTVLWASLLAWAIALRLAWVAPLGAVLASLLAGSLLGALTRRDEESPRWTPALGWAAAALTAAAFALLVPPAFVEIRAAVRDHARTADAATLEADFAAWPDATYARIAMEKRMAAGSDADLQRALEVAAQVASQNTVNVDSALTSARLQQLYGIRTGIDTADEFTAAIEAGRLADPSSGLWDYAGALAAALRRDRPSFDRHAARALEHRLPEVAETWLRANLATVTPAAP